MRANLLTATEASAKFAQKQLTSRELLDSCLNQIASREPIVQAWQFLDRKRAADRAAEADWGMLEGLLTGIPLGIKDIIDTADMPTTYGSKLFDGNMPTADAVCVNKLREAGMITLGKTVSTEFAYLQPSKTANPSHPAYSPGGSSSGSAAAVAACMVPVALATQTAGSCIRPSSYCGVFGYKPTFGLFDTTGVMRLAQSLDTLCLIARSVKDIALVGGQLSNRIEPLATLPGPPPARIGFAILSEEWSVDYPEAFAVYNPIKRKLADAGISFVDVDLSKAVRGLHGLHGDILSFEAACNFGALYDMRDGDISAPVAELVGKGRAISGSDFQQKLSEAERHRSLMDRLLEDFDIVITPSAPGGAPRRDAGTGLPIFNSFWTLLHVPCITIPALKTASGLPLGIQLTSRRDSDQALLAHSETLAEVLGA
ncbi:amidase [Bradyrhizobium sp. LjRoot220]|uniref:amidase n=1 Tax=Bradyrhizobium sp. LjRoot220 TaxID=3342284 RepID=UPI003ECE5956